jgi:hypothetical protein
MWNFLNSDFGLLLVAFVLTTILGSILSAYIAWNTWRRQTRLAFFRQRYDEGIKLLDELGKLIGKRFFLLQRYLSAIENMSPEEIDNYKKASLESVQDWNTKRILFRAKIRLLVGEELALEFLDYSDDARVDLPRSLHYIFVRTHKRVFEVNHTSPQYEIESAWAVINKLNWSCSNFIEKITNEFLSRAKSLELIDVPTVKGMDPE